ncbi:MAG: hypothetical protein Q7S31_03720 [bacterium]|nr:hypothetical protein [bacterium]
MIELGLPPGVKRSVSQVEVDLVADLLRLCLETDTSVSLMFDPGRFIPQDLACFRAAVEFPEFFEVQGTPGVMIEVGGQVPVDEDGPRLFPSVGQAAATGLGMLFNKVAAENGPEVASVIFALEGLRHKL